MKVLDPRNPPDGSRCGHAQRSFLLVLSAPSSGLGTGGLGACRVSSAAGPGRSRPGEVGSRLMSGAGVGGRPSPGGGRWFSDDCVSRQLLNPGVLSTTALRSEPGTLLPGPSLPCWGLKVFLSVFYSKKMKVLEALIGMIQKFPYDDPTYDKLHEDLDRIRGKFKQVCVPHIYV